MRFPTRPFSDRFVFEPFDHVMSPLSPSALAHCEAEFEGLRAEYLLQMWRNFIFFCRAPQTENGRVFALTRPLEDDWMHAEAWRETPEKLVAFFERELAAGRWGLLRASRTEGEGNTLLIVWDASGEVQVRPWWDDRVGAIFRWPGAVDGTPRELRYGWLETPYQGLAYDEGETEHTQWRERLRFLRRLPGRRASHLLTPAEVEAWKQTPPTPGLMSEVRKRWPSLPRHRVHSGKLIWRAGNARDLRDLARSVCHVAPADPTAFAFYELDYSTGLPDQEATLDINGQLAPKTRIPLRKAPSEEADDARFDCWTLLVQLHHQAWGFGWFEADAPSDEPLPAEQLQGEARVVPLPLAVPDLDAWQVGAPSAHERLEATQHLRHWIEKLVVANAMDASDAAILHAWTFENAHLEEATIEALFHRLFTSWPDD